jgi:anti-anti-sigma factor
LYDTLLTIETVDAACVVAVRSEIDIANADTFRRYVDEASIGAEALVVSFAECTYLDSTGLREVIRWAEARRDTFAVVLPAGSRVRRVFDLAGIHAIVRVFETNAEALTATLKEKKALV